MHGGGGGTGPGGIKRARIEIIPLIDVIFFLLATFVLFTLSLNKSNGISVKLPTAVTSEPRDPNGTVTISVTDEGTVAWNKDLITLDEFTQRLLQYKRENPDGRILINGDEHAMLGSAVKVLDEVRKSGIRKVSVQTQGKSA